MFLRFRTYEIESSVDGIFTRIELDAREVNRLFLDSFTDHTEQTSKTWVTSIDRKSNRFEMVRANRSSFFSRYLDGNFFDLTIDGKIVDVGNKRKAEICYNVGATAWGLFILLLTMIVTVFINFIIDGEWESLSAFVFFSIIFLIVLIVFQVQFKDTEEKIMAILGAHEEG
jgi:hypothetical protein